MIVGEGNREEVGEEAFGSEVVPRGVGSLSAEGVLEDHGAIYNIHSIIRGAIFVLSSFHSSEKDNDILVERFIRDVEDNGASENLGRLLEVVKRYRQYFMSHDQ
jgi:hypothetical protein